MNTPERKLPPPMPEGITNPKPPEDATKDYDRKSVFEFSKYLESLDKNERVYIKIPLRAAPSATDLKRWLTVFYDRLVDVKIFATQAQHDQRPDIFGLVGVTWEKVGN